MKLANLASLHTGDFLAFRCAQFPAREPFRSCYFSRAFCSGEALLFDSHLCLPPPL